MTVVYQTILDCSDKEGMKGREKKKGESDKREENRKRGSGRG